LSASRKWPAATSRFLGEQFGPPQKGESVHLSPVIFEFTRPREAAGEERAALVEMIRQIRENSPEMDHCSRSAEGIGQPYMAVESYFQVIAGGLEISGKPGGIAEGQQAHGLAALVS